MSELAKTMVDYYPRVAEPENFFEWSEGQSYPIGQPDMESIIAATREPIYGPVVASNMAYYRGEANIDAETALQALQVLITTTRSSSEQYYTDYPSFRPGESGAEHDAFLQALGGMQVAMASGEIQLLAPNYGMSAARGKYQVGLADSELSRQTPAVQRLLSDTNYSLYFTFRTMADGRDILRKTIEDEVESQHETQMPHVIRTNLAMGQLGAAIIQAARGRFTVLGAGAGTGGTTTPLVSALNQVSTYDKLSLHDIEPNRDFYARLAALAREMICKIEAVNPDFRLVAPNNGTVVPHDHVYELINDDVTQVIGRLEALPNDQKDVTMMLANYSWHRLPLAVKVQMISKIGSLAKNSIFLIADLEKNGSQVNRHYFNLGNNGPLNCGNLGLSDAFSNLGYAVVKLGTGRRPTSVHPKLMERIETETDNDGHFWIAYKGEEAERLVQVA